MEAFDEGTRMREILEAVLQEHVTNETYEEWFREATNEVEDALGTDGETAIPPGGGPRARQAPRAPTSRGKDHGRGVGRDAIGRQRVWEERGLRMMSNDCGDPQRCQCSDAATGSATSRSLCRNLHIYLHIHPAPQQLGSGRGAEAHKGPPRASWQRSMHDRASRLRRMYLPKLSEKPRRHPNRGPTRYPNRPVRPVLDPIEGPDTRPERHSHPFSDSFSTHLGQWGICRYLPDSLVSVAVLTRFGGSARRYSRVVRSWPEKPYARWLAKASRKLLGARLDARYTASFRKRSHRDRGKVHPFDAPPCSPLCL